MAVATIDQIIFDVKSVLPIADTDMYDTQLNILVNASISKLEDEGIPNVFEYESSDYYNYLTCVRYQVACDLDLDIDIEKLEKLYITRANTLRCSLNRKSN